MRFQIELWFARDFARGRMRACKAFLHWRKRVSVLHREKKRFVFSVPGTVSEKRAFFFLSLPSTSSSPPFAPSSYFSRWIFAGFVSWRATGYRWSVPLKQPATGFNLQVGLFRASQTQRLPALAGNSQFPANSAISCCVRPPRNALAGAYGNVTFCPPFV